MKNIHEYLTPEAINRWETIRNNPANTDLTIKALLSRIMLLVDEAYTPFAIPPKATPTINTTTSTKRPLYTQEQADKLGYIVDRNDGVTLLHNGQAVGILDSIHNRFDYPELFGG